MYVVFDIGGTKLRVGISQDGKTLETTKIVPVPKQYDVGIALLRNVMQELTVGEHITAVAGGIAGPLSKDKSQLVAAPNLPGWIGKPLAKDITSMCHAPVILENDAAIVGLGEAVFGSGKGKHIVMYITLSTGVGGARFVDGTIDANTMGFEPGHQILDPNGPLCPGCEKPGHFEAFSSGTAIEKKYNKKSTELTASEWDEVLSYTAIGLTNCIVLWSPDVVVLGGKVSEALPLDRLTPKLQELLRIFPKPPVLHKASLGDTGGLYGALALLPK